MFFMRGVLLFALSTAVPALADDNPPNRAELWQLLQQRNFAELDAKLSARQKVYERDFRTGDYVERDLSRAMRVFYVRDESIAPLLDEWVAKMPRSYVAALAHGEFLAVVAKERRTGKFAHQVTLEQWAAAREVAARAGAELERSLTLTERPILSYAVLIDISDLYRGSKDKGLLLAEANSLDPRNYYPNSEYLVKLTPRWGGSMREMTDFLTDYRSLNPPKWKGDCMEAHVLDEKTWSPGWNPTKPASAENVSSMDRAIELCPRWDRYSKRGAFHYTRGELGPAEVDFRSALQFDPWSGYAMAQLGALLQNQGKFDEAARLCRDSAAVRQPGGMRCFAWANFSGNGIKKNPTEALRLLHECVALDDAGCKTALADYYWYGLGTPEGKAKATKLWQEAAADSDTQAAAKLRELRLSPKQ